MSNPGCSGQGTAKSSSMDDNVTPESKITWPDLCKWQRNGHPKLQECFLPLSGLVMDLVEEHM